jgi:hypothetical protein
MAKCNKNPKNPKNLNQWKPKFYFFTFSPFFNTLPKATWGPSALNTLFLPLAYEKSSKNSVSAFFIDLATKTIKVEKKQNQVNVF